MATKPPPTTTTTDTTSTSTTTTTTTTATITTASNYNDNFNENENDNDGEYEYEYKYKENKNKNNVGSDEYWRLDVNGNWDKKRFYERNVGKRLIKGDGKYKGMGYRLSECGVGDIFERYGLKDNDNNNNK